MYDLRLSIAEQLKNLSVNLRLGSSWKTDEQAQEDWDRGETLWNGAMNLEWSSKREEEIGAWRRGYGDI